MPPYWIPILAGAGTLGAILPDIDSDSGRPLRIIFPACAALLPPLFLWRLPLLHESTLHALGAWAALSWLIFRPARWLISHLSRHRGAFHSIPAALCFGALLFIIASAEALSREISLALALCGAGGYLVHLLLDELYAIDFNGARLKRSFGSALCVRSGGWGDLFLLFATPLLCGVAFCLWEGAEFSLESLEEVGRDRLRRLLEWAAGRL